MSALVTSESIDEKDIAELAKWFKEHEKRR
jgi:hypothetical protein